MRTLIQVMSSQAWVGSKLSPVSYLGANRIMGPQVRDLMTSQVLISKYHHAGD